MDKLEESLDQKGGRMAKGAQAERNKEALWKARGAGPRKNGYKRRQGDTGSRPKGTKTIKLETMADERSLAYRKKTVQYQPEDEEEEELR